MMDWRRCLERIGWLVSGATLPLLMVIPVQSSPRLVVLLRHGHKDSPVNQARNYNLSRKGLVDALRLGHMLMACVLPDGPMHLASYSFDDRSGKNARSYQTLVPLAVFTGQNIRVFSSADERSERIGRELVAAPEFEGGTVVMAWEHRHLPMLARGLGWSRMPRIRDDDFDGLWLLRYSGVQGEPAVSQMSQAELRRRDCFIKSGPAGHPLQQLAQQLLLPLMVQSGER
jgi:hypothetical protein